MDSHISKKTEDAKPFDWKGWDNGRLPELGLHSAAKLQVLTDYVEDYIAILCTKSFGQERFRITLVDGFCGGGLYEDAKLGSPFTLLKAVESAEARLNLSGRVKKIHIDCDYHYIDENKPAINCLRYQLEQSGYKKRIGEDIFLHEGKFENKCQTVIERLKKRHPKAGSRVIFFLDQCGYNQINPALLHTISNQLNDKAEFIVNFAIEWLAEFIGDNHKFRKIFKSLGLESEISVDSIIKAKENGGLHWKYIVESQIGPAFQKIAGSPFFSPFYIEPVGSHRGYWLLHLAPHERARSAMLDVYWKNANSHRHFGHVGLDMLAFKADADGTGYFEGMSFDKLTREAAKTRLSQDFARVIRDIHSDGVNFEQFTKKYSNQTIANNDLMAEVVSDLAGRDEIIVTGPKGSQKRSSNIQPGDIIRPCNQMNFSLPLFGKKLVK